MPFRSGWTAGRREARAKRDHAYARRLAEAPNERGARRGPGPNFSGREGDDNVGERVERDRDSAEEHELDGDGPRRVHELGQEGQEEGRRLRVQGLDQHALAEGSSRPDGQLAPAG